jgi:hypothetical protein
MSPFLAVPLVSLTRPGPMLLFRGHNHIKTGSNAGSEGEEKEEEEREPSIGAIVFDDPDIAEVGTPSGGW